MKEVGEWELETVMERLHILTGIPLNVIILMGILVSGILSRNNGDQYTAKWFDYKSGKGTIKYKNGDVYVGDLKPYYPMEKES